MPLGSTWWATGWTVAQFVQNWASATIAMGPLETDHENQTCNSWVVTGATTIYQPNFSRNRDGNTKERGRLYARQIGGSGEDRAAIICRFAQASTYEAPRGLTPAWIHGDLEPVFQLTQDFSARYQLPFNYTTPYAIRLFFQFPARFGASNSTTWELRHYQPYCYWGGPAKAIAALLRHKGLSTDFINMTEFDLCYDSQEGSTDYGASVDDRPIVFVCRRLGEKIGETILNIAMHSVDMVGFDMSGKFAMFSRLRPRSVAGSSVLESIVGQVEWSYTNEHLFSSVWSTFGEVVKFSGDFRYSATVQDVDTGEERPQVAHSYEANWEPALESDGKGKYLSHTYDSGAIALYGSHIQMEGGREIEVVRNTFKATVRAFHFPYFKDSAPRTKICTMAVGEHYKQRRQVEIEQNIAGLDFDIGHKITNFALTADGQTIADLRCVAKSIDFRTMRVRSTLTEVPI
jgi:hypothetical protein